MIKIPKKYIRRLKSLDIGVIYLFGSQAQGTANFASDFDIGVVLIDPSPLSDYKEYGKIYDELHEIFFDLFIKDRRIEVDIVPLQKAPYSIRFEAIKHGKVLYEISSEFRANFEEFTTKMYLDFKPLLE
jgi:predicted nucleotidyltransferase